MVMKNHEEVKRKPAVKKTAKNRPAFIRASISFPTDIYRSLEDIARQKKVSLAWVVRDATEQYLVDRKTETGAR